MRHTPLNIGPVHRHPVGASLIHRPIPEHFQHLPGHTHSITTAAPVAHHRMPNFRAPPTGRPR